jgi:hypothetical protein
MIGTRGEDRDDKREEDRDEDREIERDEDKTRQEKGIER